MNNIDDNKKMLEKVKIEYSKIIKIVLVIIIVIALLFSIKFIYVFNVLKRNLKAELSLGNNYKIIYNEIHGDSKQEIQVYCKEDLKMIVSKTDDDSVSYSIPNENRYMTLYNINLKEKTYKKYENAMDLLFESYFKYFNTIRLTKIEDISLLKTSLEYINKIGREEYEGKNYIVLQNNGYKYWIDPETYYMKIKKYEDQITEYITIEKNTVTDKDMKIPDLSDYQEISN